MRFLYTVLFIIISSCSTSSENNEQNTLTQPEKKNDRITELQKRGNLLYEINDYKMASMTFDSLIKLDSTIGDVFYKKGFSDSQNKNITKSSLCFEKSIQLKYRVADSYYNLGLNQMLLSMDSINYRDETSDAKAIEYFEKCLKSNPSKETEKGATDMITAFRKNKKLEM